MSRLEELSKYQKLYDICISKIGGLIEEEVKRYGNFLEESNISAVPNLEEEGCLYFLAGKRVTKEAVDELYEIYKINNYENKTA